MPEVPPELLELLTKLPKVKPAHVSTVVAGLLGDMKADRKGDSDIVSNIFL
jgi:hypothetical protein